MGFVITGVSIVGGAWFAYLVVPVAWDAMVVANTGLFAVLVAAAGLFPLPVGPRIKAGMTTAALFAAVLLLPPGAAAMAAVVGGVVYQVGLRYQTPPLRLPWFKYPFNAGETALSTGGASWVFHALAGDGLLTLAVAVAMGVMYAANTGLIVTVVSVQIREAPWRLWWQGTRENGLAELSLFAFGYLGAVAYQEHPMVLVALLTPVFVIYFAFSRLARANGLLEEALERVQGLQGQLLQNAKLATVGAFTLDLGHQVKNPLFIVIGRLEGMQQRMAAGDPMAPKLEEALEGAWRINELTDAFLSVARQRWVELDLVPMLEEAIGMAMSRTSKTVQVHQRYAERPFTIQGNPILLREALNNLVTNAVEAVAEDGELTVDLVGEDGRVVVGIRDNGPGIPKAQMGHLFEPFNSSKGNGLGLGLFSAKHIVEMHEGLLRVESPAGGGTRVEVDLPVRASAERSLLAPEAHDNGSRYSAR